MTPPHTPHFLRVVQALALVSGFGPVAIVAGVTLLGCGGSSSVQGVAACPDANECPVGVNNPADAASDAFTGIPTGTQPGCTLNEAGTCADASIGSGGIGFPPDAKADVIIVGGPLPPPELPA